MIPSSVPLVLEHLTQVEEMLIAHALPITDVYLKPGGSKRLLRSLDKFTTKYI